MKNAIVEMFQSKKFLALLATLVLWGAARVGLNVDQAQIDKALGLVGALILAWGIQDHGEAKAKVEAAAATSSPDSTVVVNVVDKKAEGGFAHLNVMLLLVFLGLTLCGCGTLKKVATNAVGCVAGNSAGLIQEAGSAMDQLLLDHTDGSGHLDKAALLGAAKSFAFDGMMCVLADSVTRALSSSKVIDPNAPKSSPVVANTGELLDLFEELRALKAPGKIYRTAAGDL